jgi:hypothetical protein
MSKAHMICIRFKHGQNHSEHGKVKTTEELLTRNSSIRNAKKTIF